MSTLYQPIRHNKYAKLTSYRIFWHNPSVFEQLQGIVQCLCKRCFYFRRNGLDGLITADIVTILS
jgi:hypothetical protein